MGKRRAYTENMTRIKAVAAPAPKSQTYARIAWAYAAILVVMVVAQLFSFEKFIPLIADYWLPGGQGTTVLVAGVIVTTEVFALPYLLRMPLSPLMRACSIGCSFVVPLLWLWLSLRALLESNAITNGGILGEKVVVPLEVQLVVSLVLLVLAVVSYYGLSGRAKTYFKK